MALDTATLDFDESSPFQLRERAKALAQGQPDQSEPVPGIAHGSIPGLLGVALNDQVRAARASLGDRPTSFADRFGASSGGSPGPAPVNGAPPMPAAAGAVPPLGPPVNVGPPPGASAGSATPPPLPAPAAPAVPQGQPPSAPQVPPQDNSLIPKDSLIGRMLASANSWRDQNRLTLLAMAGGLAGSQSIGQGLGRAFSAAVPAQQADIKQNQQNLTAQALIHRGVSPEIAQAAANNPALLQQILPQLFGAKQQQHVTIKDRLGNEIPYSYDPSSGKYTPANIGGGAGATLGAGDPTKTGEEYLKTLDPLTQNEVKAFSEGRAPVSARNLQQMLPLVTQYDPSFDASQYAVRQATRKNYTSGKQFQELQALNTVAGHLDDFRKSADALDNTSFPLLNRAVNAYRTNTGDDRVDNFNTVKQAVTNELSKAYRGGHVTEGDVREWQENVSAAKSPQQLRGVIGKMNDLLMSKRQALEDGYKSSMGPAPLPSEFKATSEHAAETFNRVGEWAHGVKTAAPSGAPATAPAGGAPAAAPALVRQNGHTYQRQPDGSYKAVE